MTEGKKKNEKRVRSGETSDQKWKGIDFRVSLMRLKGHTLRKVNFNESLLRSCNSVEKSVERREKREKLAFFPFFAFCTRVLRISDR